MLAAYFDAFQRVPMSSWVTGGGAAFLAFLGGLAFTNGVIKQIFSMLSIAFAGTVAWYCFRHRVDVFGPGATSMSTDRILTFSMIAGAIAFGLGRFLIGFLSIFGIFKVFTGMVGWRAFFVSLVPSSFLLWACMMALRLVGNIYGLEGASAISREGTRVGGSFGAWVNDLRRVVERSSVGGIVSKLDPFSVRASANLTRLLIVWPDKSLWPALSANSLTKRVFSHPKVHELGYDQTVRAYIDRKDYAGLLQLPQVESVAAYPDLEPILSDAALEEAMDGIIYKRR
jgi:hypothetical protein